jgi:hypothetical protein
VGSRQAKTGALDQLRNILREKAGCGSDLSYLVPGFLIGHPGDTRPRDVGDPYLFYAQVCDDIFESPIDTTSGEGAPLVEGDLVYLSFIRTFAALDNRIGTALSQIAFLPFIRNCLGANVFISLPTGVIGSTNRRGRRGSPFALADPFATDPSFADPLIPEMSAHDQYRALAEACLLLGMQLGSVIPTATLSIDSPLLRDNPDLTFWWDAKAGETLTTMPSDLDEVAAEPRFLPLLPEVTKGRFAEPPESPAREIRLPGGDNFLVGQDRSGRQVTVANAFTDVHPDDSDCAVWPDVAMLNYTSLTYPYFAGADSSSIFNSSRPACTLTQEVIEWRHSEFHETVFLVDLSANVPPEVLDRARAGIEAGGNVVTFIGEELWSFDAQNEGVDVVVGPLPYCVSAHTRNREVLVESLRYHLQLLERRAGNNPYLAGLANHDTMPVLPELAPLLYTCYAFLPRAVTLVFSGSEWNAQTVTNPEFGLSTTERLRSMRRTLGPEVRALFNDVPVPWLELADGERHAHLLPLNEKLARLRSTLRVDGSWDYAFWAAEGDDPGCFGYRRESRDRSTRLLVAANLSEATVEIETQGNFDWALEASPSGLETRVLPGSQVAIRPDISLVLASRPER